MRREGLAAMAATFVGLSMGLAGTVGAEILATHSGSNDPESGGWEAYATIGGVNWDHTTTPEAGPVTVGGVEAWRVWDYAVGGNVFTYESSSEMPYRINPSLNSGDNWRYSAHVNPHDYGNDPANLRNAAMTVNVFSYYYFGSPVGFSYTLTMGDDGQGGTLVNVNGFSTTVDDGWFWIDMIYDTTDGFSFYIDGQLVSDSIAANGYIFSYASVRWGDLQQVGSGAGGSDWAFVEFEADPVDTMSPIGTIPEPASLALLAAGVGVCVMRRRG